jgi:hypothetical protein
MQPMPKKLNLAVLIGCTAGAFGLGRSAARLARQRNPKDTELRKSETREPAACQCSGECHSEVTFVDTVAFIYCHTHQALRLVEDVDENLHLRRAVLAARRNG